MKVQLASKTLDLAISTCAHWNRQPQKFKLIESIGLYKDIPDTQTLTEQLRQYTWT